LRFTQLFKRNPDITLSLAALQLAVYSVH
jgi:hypothetical protein